jgi:hypothetical protein
MDMLSRSHGLKPVREAQTEAGGGRSLPRSFFADLVLCPSGCKLFFLFTGLPSAGTMPGALGQ